MSPSRGRRAGLRGRWVVAVLLIAFVVVATAVIWRRGYAVKRGEELRALTRRRNQLRAERASLERQVGELAGRSALGGVAERRLDMHIPADSQVIILPAPTLAPAGNSRAAP
jgi:cell division protein FtsL